jgi:3-hydroxybutyryl-CoA dehydrogenase
MKKVLILGAGTMGSGIAQVFAEGGYDVILRDIKDEYVEKGMSYIKKNYARQIEKGKVTKEKADAVLARITGTVELAAAKDCDLVIEAAVENMEIKKQVFSELEAICKPEAIFATNTSSLSITELATSTKRPDRFIGMHFFNPAPVMKLIEIIRGMATSDQTHDEVKKLCVDLGKEPVEVKESAGFVVNRILVPMINEAVGVLADGVASAEDIDKAMMLGSNHPMGPLTLSDFIGNDVVLAILEVLQRETGDDKYRPHPLLRKYVRAGWLGRKPGKGFFEYGK